MLNHVRTWLNGNRNYFKGVILYANLGADAELLAVLKKGPNDFRERRLLSEMQAICDRLKEEDPDHQITKSPNHQITDHRSPITPSQNHEPLYAACKREADQAYKKVMNARAVIFAQANESIQNFTDPNLPEKIRTREKLCIEVVVGFQEVSMLYDRAKYVKENGRLPETEDKPASEFDNLPDSLVKAQLDNARKAFNKLKGKEATPARIELMQRHQENIKKLEEKWNSLKQP